MAVYVHKIHKITTGRLELPGISEQVPMRKLIFFMFTSLDGYYEGPGHAIDWHNVDVEFNEFANAQLDSEACYYSGGLLMR